MEWLSNAIGAVNGVLWGWPMILFLLGTHIFMTVRTGVIQRKVFRGIRLSVSKDPDASGDISQFGALTTALASTIGTGNIIGVGTAIALGGPGAVLWTWITGIFGIATKYAESLIAVKYRVRTSDGTMLGGAMYALERGLNMRWLGIVFAFLGALAAFGIGCCVQANAIADSLQNNFHIEYWITGLVVAALTAVVILGGVKSIARVCEKLVPFMSLFYVAGCVTILVINRHVLWDTVCLICSAAFTPRAAGGGFVGSTVMIAARWGMARGLFSNESGMGSAPIVSAAARTRNPVRQALVASTGTFWDTVVICLLTGLVLVSTILANDGVTAEGVNGGQLSSAAFAQIPYIGTPILIVGLVTFAFSTILGWSYYGERCAEYLLGPRVRMPYRILWVLVVFVGAILSIQLVWDGADLLNALMAIPNLVAVLLLSGVVARETKMYLGDLDRKDETPIPVVDREKR